MEDNMKDKRKSIWKYVLTVVVTGVVTFVPTYHFYYQQALGYQQQQVAVMQEQVKAINEEIEANNAWEHYNSLRDAIHEKWYYIRSDDYDKLLFGSAFLYDYDFEQISEHCDGIREALRAKNWKECWESVETGYDMLKKLPGPLWIEKPD